MARIPAQDLEQLKNEISVQRLVESSGVELKKGGKDFTGICPFHADETASLVITPHKNLWHCFGCRCKCGGCWRRSWRRPRAEGFSVCARSHGWFRVTGIDRCCCWSSYCCSQRRQGGYWADCD